LIAIKDIKRAGYSSVKIAEAEFARSQKCDPTVRATWPNVGGASWKRRCAFWTSKGNAG
jgi:hypothetical protein